MILTDEEIREIDTSEYWFEHTPHEFARVIEAAVLEKLADKLRDADRLEYHLQGNSLTVKMKKSVIMFGPNKEPEYPSAFRCAIDAAMLASKAGKP